MSDHVTTLEVRADTSQIDRARESLGELARARDDFERDANGRLRDGRGRFVREGEGGDGGGGDGGGGGGGGGDGGKGKGGGGGGVGQAPMPDWGGVASVAGMVPLVGGVLAGAVMAAAQMHGTYSAYEKSVAARRAYDGHRLTPSMEGTGIGLGMGPTELQGEMATLLGGGFNRDALEAGTGGVYNVHDALRLALRGGKAYGVGTGTMGSFLGMFRPGGGVRSDMMHEQMPEFALRTAMASGLNAGVQGKDMERYLQVIAEHTGTMAEQGFDINPTTLPFLAETLRAAVAGGAGAAGIDLAKQFQGMRGLNAAQSFANAVVQTGQGQGNAIQEALLFQEMGGAGESFFETKFRMQNAMRDPKAMGELMKRTIGRFREAPGDVFERWNYLQQAFPSMNGNDLMALLTGSGEVDADELGMQLAGQGMVGVNKDVSARLAKQPRRFASQTAALDAADIRTAGLNSRGLLGADKAFRSIRNRLGAGAAGTADEIVKFMDSSGATKAMAKVIDSLTAVSSAVKAAAQGGTNVTISLSPAVQQFFNVLSQPGSGPPANAGP